MCVPRGRDGVRERAEEGHRAQPERGVVRAGRRLGRGDRRAAVAADGVRGVVLTRRVVSCEVV